VSNFVADDQIGAVTFVIPADQLIWGAELETVVVPVTGVNVRLAYALLRPEYTRLFDRDSSGDLIDRSDEGAFANSPEHTVNLGVAYTAPPTRAGIFTIAANTYWQDREDYLLYNNDLIDQGDYWLLGGRLQLAEIPGPYGVFDLVVWGRNLLDQQYRTFGIDFNTLGFAGNTYGNPRTFGFDLIWRWGGGTV
jgi:iron complex outermembrane receptor protein